VICAGEVRAAGSSAMPASGFIEAQWNAGRRGLQPHGSIVSRGVEAEVLPTARRYG
jgi:aryl-alcohol dehydrogenase-like predicted oxidoreductase